MKSKIFVLALVLSILLTSCDFAGELTRCSLGHTDADDNGICDVCRESVMTSVDIYAVNDLHGKLLDTASQPGIDELTTMLESEKIANENTVLISSGDMWQGSFESVLTDGLIITDWMNELGFASMTLGNHEFDWGEEYIRKNSDIAEFSILAINVYEKSTGERPDYCEASRLIELDGITVGIIGAIGDCESSISSDKIENIGFKTGAALTKLVRDEATRLRAEGADLIIYSLHDGHSGSGTGKITQSSLKRYYDSILSTGYADIVFEGHTHREYVLSDAAGVYHIQAGGENEAISHAEIKYNTVSGSKSVSKPEIIGSEEYSRFWGSDFIDELENKYSTELAPGYQILGTNTRYRDDEEIEAKVAELYLEAGLEKWGEEYDIFLGGGFLRTRAPYNLSIGEVSYADILMILPFDNNIVLCSVSGYYLKKKFIDSTSSDYYTAYSGFGTENKGKINTGGTYYIIVDTYTAQYKPNNLTVIDTLGADIYARDLLADYILSGGFGL
ncbi:MAG: metallophosphoesterase [Clostridia bacterium]|nr:metallophosphoesterase [Clostridia bacterium]